ncbi:hypothetical protein SS1G_09493 [Sclerotinia sclerotiorum 1980 UF-70]|uniref:Uncharacterized protein n=1 Tax=Sclerotinia sclerotiorum (strain ATCC 18683 / 1980 / Ss-1) TaxID=665079 RepID=A7EVY4_SCLS1|nr:hypothetical protein SS1G_09493 [Sclerotinia sclerotiorum 1980 UF-70]EDN93626.1 hypothetical protein SS1G_09493 [Sclerotinia sclerotiorum 1980 UF-70]
MAVLPENSGYIQTSDPKKPRSDAAVPFRDIIPSPDHPRIAGIQDHTALSWCESRRQIEAPAWLIDRLEAKNLERPYKGFTSDGNVRRGLSEEMDSLSLMQSLPKELQDKATLSKGMDGKSLPDDRWNPFDERHLGGARQDNRIVPYEGCPVSEFSADKQEQIIKLFKTFNEYYPDAVLEHRVALFKKHLDETYFAWIGKFGDDDPYYYRIHSPVAFMELDFHCGRPLFHK